jgi:non-ribosomal peptide synthetase component F
VSYRESFLTVLEQVKAETLKVFAYQSYPLEQVFADLNNRYPEINVSFNMVNVQETTAGPPGESSSPRHVVDSQDAKFDLELYVSEYQQGLGLQWSYKKTLFRPETIEYLNGEYTRIMAYMSRDKNRCFQDYLDQYQERKFKKRKRDYCREGAIRDDHQAI